MSKIIRAQVLTASEDSSDRRVKLKADGIWDESPLIDSINGLFLRKGEWVFVDVSDGYESPLILGRVCNWLEAQELTDLLNTIIDKINDNADKFNKHTHVCDLEVATTGTAAAQTGKAIGSTQKPLSVVTDMESVTVDDVIHKD